MTPEGSLLRAVTDLLTAERIWWCRQNTGSIVLGEGKSRRCFTSGRKGMADLLVIRTCIYPAHGCGFISFQRVLWLELKSLKGVQSPAQKEFQREVEAEGHAYLLVRDVRQVQTWLKENA
jgi:hypothetical protein